jgi:mannose-1-phosphate guanylyltransferase
VSGLQGVLLLTAGFGSRAEPLSLFRPKALLPFRESTLLGLLAGEASALDPEVMAVNASRCPELVRREACESSGREVRLLFEERPLGLAGTLARLSGDMSGPWMIMNTDMVIRADLPGLLDRHRQSGAPCTLLCGDPPEHGAYGTVKVGGRARHYFGVCVIEPGVARRCAECQGFLNFLSGFIVGEPEGFQGVAEWMDMGTPELYRRNLLSKGSFVHGSAEVSPDAALSGECHVYGGCRVEAGARVEGSVMLPGSVLPGGAVLRNTVLPWFARGGPVRRDQ